MITDCRDIYIVDSERREERAMANSNHQPVIDSLFYSFMPSFTHDAIVHISLYSSDIFVWYGYNMLTHI